MKKTQHLLLFTALFFLAGFANAQTADEVIAKHVEAVGGKDKLNGITSFKSESTMSVMGNSTSTVATVVPGKGFKSETDFQGQKIVQIVSDKGGWAMNPMSGSTDLQPMPEEQYKGAKESIYAYPLYNYNTRGGKVELAGKEKAGDKDAYKINYTSADNVEVTYYIDANTYYILKTVQKANMMGQEAEITTTFSNYKKTDYGVVMPYTTDIDYAGQFQISSELNKIEFNKPVDPAIFTPKL